YRICSLLFIRSHIHARFADNLATPGMRSPINRHTTLEADSHTTQRPPGLSRNRRPTKVLTDERCTNRPAPSLCNPNHGAINPELYDPRHGRAHELYAKANRVQLGFLALHR